MREKKIKALLTQLEKGNLKGKEKLWIRKFLQYYQSFSPKKVLNETEKQEVLKQVSDHIFDHAISSQKKQRIVPFHFIRIAASVIFILTSSTLGFMFGYNWFKSQQDPSWITAKAARGTTVHLMLTDSSEIWLYPGSSIRYPNYFKGDNRMVYITEGKAFFKVKHNPKKGFWVHAPYLITKDIGTSFTVSSFNKSPFSHVQVFTGEVSVALSKNLKKNISQLNKEVFLNPGQQISYRKSNGTFSQSSFHEKEDSEGAGEGLRFEKLSLADIMIAIENRFNIEISFHEEGLKYKVITASFSPQTSPQAMIKALTIFSGIHFKMSSATHYILY